MKAHYLCICLSLFFISCSNQDEENQFVQYVDVQYKYTEVYSFSEGLSLVVRDGLYGFVDKTGVEVIPCQFNSASSFKEGLALVKKGASISYINKNGEEVIQCAYQSASSFSNGMACVEMNGKQGFIDKSGDLVIPCTYKNTSNYNGKSVWFYDGNLWGVSFPDLG